MLSFLLGALALGQEAPPNDTVDIGGRSVALVWPGPAAPEVTWPTVEVGGLRFGVLPDGSLGRPARVDGSWSDAKLRYAPGSEKATPYRCLVILIERWTFLDISKGPVVRRRGTLEPFLIEEIEQGLARFKALAEASAGNRISIKFDVMRDQDPGFTILDKWSFPGPTRFDATTPPDPNNFVSQLVIDRVGPRFNDERFDSDTPGYRGPFSSVFVIHAGLVDGSANFWVDNTPVTLLSHSTISQDKIGLSLPSALFSSWQNHVAGLSQGPSFMKVGRILDRFTARPDWVGGGEWATLAEAAARRERPKGEPPALADAPEGASVWMADGRLAARPEAVSALRAALPNWKDPVVWAPSSAGPVALVPVTGSPASAVRALGLEPPTVQAKSEPRQVGTTIGDHEAKLETGADGKNFWRVTQTGITARGDFLFADVTGSSARSAKFLVRTESPGAVLVKVLGPDRKTPVARHLIVGEAPPLGDCTDDADLSDARVPNDGQWHQVAVPLPVGSTEFIVAPYAAGFLERPTFGPSTLDLAEFETSADSAPTPKPYKFDFVPGTEDWTMNALTQGNENDRLRACVFLARNPNPSSVSVLAPMLRSGDPVLALMAGFAVSRTEGDEAWSAIKTALEQGPFDHNRRFAAMWLAQRPDPAMGASLGLMTARSASARLEAVRALAAIKEESADVILIAMMANEPDPGVRVEIARLANLENSLVNRRLLFAALNDESQWVRTTCLLRLIQSPDAKTRREAFQGVRDPAVGIRLALLAAMAEDPDDFYRPALRVAVTDREARVRAAALRALAKQPGPVSRAEVANVAKDTDVEVAAAYAALAKAKGLEGP
ncbi:MAG: HEAT repeat domain-containing protein [Fimbriimonadaceae bacterium]|nr:HEAT repeat domain-containing protein [Fimbriimonadaceae bacterium]QYK57566.1 MAG: HEAT repeat domain-containing protein [Fimbriimonadaceae bacterium]